MLYFHFIHGQVNSLFIIYKPGFLSERALSSKHGHAQHPEVLAGHLHPLLRHVRYEALYCRWTSTVQPEGKLHSSFSMIYVSCDVNRVFTSLHFLVQRTISHDESPKRLYKTIFLLLIVIKIDSFISFKFWLIAKSVLEW